MRHKGMGALLALVAVGLGSAYAFGASETIASSATCCTFTQPAYTIDAGTVAEFSNVAASGDHNVYAAGNGPDGQPLFHSGELTGGQVGPVEGTQYLSPGTYHLVCTIHPGMEADLVVSAGGTPVARPSIKVKVLSSKLAKVISSGKLTVKVSAATQGNGIALTASKGANKLAGKGKIDLAAGSSRTIKLPLTSSGRGALAHLSSAKVKLTGTVPFGAPARASRKLR